MSRKLHPDITFERIQEAITDEDYVGFCIACGAEKGGCEPDARNYLCDNCDENQVFGAEEILMQFGDQLGGS